VAISKPEVADAKSKWYQEVKVISVIPAWLKPVYEGSALLDRSNVSSGELRLLHTSRHWCKKTQAGPQSLA